MLQKYLTEFVSLNTNKRAGIIAPHKPILLLSVMDLFEQGQLNGTKIELSDSLERTFRKNWDLYIGIIPYYRPNIDKPFWHLKNEPFWRLVSKTGTPVDLIKSPYSVETLRNNVYAVIDEELAQLMMNAESREILKKGLVEKYLNNKENMVQLVAPMFSIICFLMNMAS